MSNELTMLSDYINAAMRRANYKLLPEDETFFGEIPGFPGIWANTKTLEECREDLEFLERYLLAGFSIKALAEGCELGYVAIRNRLDRIIESYRRLHEGEEAKRAILERLENGAISAEAAAEEIERL